MLNLPIYFTLLEVIRMHFDGKQDLYISQMMPAIFSTCICVQICTLYRSKLVFQFHFP